MFFSFVENNMERDFNVRRKRKFGDVAGTPRKKIKGCNITHSSEPCNKVQEDVRVRKRRASEVSVEDFTKQWGKRKASDDAGTSEKKIRCSSNSTNSSEPSARSAEDSWVQRKKRKASDDGDAPRKKLRCSDSAINFSTSGSSATRSSSSESSEKVLKDGKDDDISHIFNDASPEEEKIFEMASSGNTSRGGLIV